MACDPIQPASTSCAIVSVNKRPRRRLILTSTARSFTRLFQVPLTALPLIAAAAYFSGWWYRNEYFSEFGVHRSTFVAADYTVFIHSFSVITLLPEVLWPLRARSLVPTAAMTVLFGLMMIGPTFGRFYNRIVRVLRVFSWPILVWTLFVISQDAGVAEAERQLATDARVAEVLLDPTLESDLSTAFGDKETSFSWRYQQINAQLQAASAADMLGLLWRDHHETI